MQSQQARIHGNVNQALEEMSLRYKGQEPLPNLSQHTHRDFDVQTQMVTMEAALASNTAQLSMIAADMLSVKTFLVTSEATVIDLSATSKVRDQQIEQLTAEVRELGLKIQALEAEARAKDQVIEEMDRELKKQAVAKDDIVKGNDQKLERMLTDKDAIFAEKLKLHELRSQAAMKKNEDKLRTDFAKENELLKLELMRNSSQLKLELVTKHEKLATDNAKRHGKLRDEQQKTAEVIQSWLETRGDQIQPALKAESDKAFAAIEEVVAKNSAELHGRIDAAESEIRDLQAEMAETVCMMGPLGHDLADSIHGRLEDRSDQDNVLEAALVAFGSFKKLLLVSRGLDNDSTPSDGEVEPADES